MSETGIQQFGGILLLLLVGCGFLLIFGVITGRKVIKVVFSIISIALLYPFFLSLMPHLDAWVLVAGALLIGIWLLGMFFGMIGGEHARGIAVSEIMIALISLPFRVLSAIFSALFGGRGRG